MKILESLRLRKEFGTLVAVKDISFSVERGQIVGLVGPNGAGTTTLLKILATALLISSIPPANVPNKAKLTRTWLP